MKEVVSFFKKEGYFVTNDFIENIPRNFNCEDFLKLLKKRVMRNEEVLVLNKDILNAVFENKKSIDLNWNEFDNSKALMEKGKDGEWYNTFLELLSLDEKKASKILEDVKKEEGVVIEEEENGEDSSVIVLKSFKEKAKKRSVEDFVGHFRKRFEAISGILRGRQELKEVLSLNRVRGKGDNERVAVIGIVVEKKITRNDNVLLKVEDLSGDINVLINKNKTELYNDAKDICDDEIVGFVGIKNGDFIFVNNLIFPEVPLSMGVKKCDNEVYCGFISDLHVGNKQFLKNEFEKFLKWLSGGNGNDEQKKIANKLKYLFITGDLVDGVGIYPGQEKDCDINDIYRQYDYFTELVKRIPKNIKIIICPGNHDASRLTEPQPVLEKKYCKELFEMDNVFMVSNPSFVNIHSSVNFSGFDVLAYHGASFNYYIDNVESIRLGG
ncbi:MAG: metallophosphoesterase, partial [Nanoarchaeota archaeon]|nr:metallophosphoesterase [Nanoarchaeota archaeon]